MGELHFSISDYSASAINGMLLWGISGCIIIGFVVIKEAVTAIRKNGAGFSTMSTYDKITLLLRSIIPAVLVFAFFFLHTWSTLKHSRFLPTESTEDGVSISGEIEQISAVFGSPQYHIGDDPTAYLASFVRIQGEEYYFLTADGLEKGMFVTIRYLPRSNMVLDCVVMSSPEQDNETTLSPNHSDTALSEADNERISSGDLQSHDNVTNILLAVAMGVLIAAMVVYGFVLRKRIKKRWQE